MMFRSYMYKFAMPFPFLSLFVCLYFSIKIGHEEEVVMFPFHKRKVKTISMKPPIFGEIYMRHQLNVKDRPNLPTDYIAAVCPVTWPLKCSEAGDDLVCVQTVLNQIILILTSLHLYIFIRKTDACIKARSPPASLAIMGQTNRNPLQLTEMSPLDNTQIQGYLYWLNRVR